jgi:DNA (cytosine-5)-methyltransferase 1
MRLLDLFCCAGGAAMGYHRAGFTEIVGIDIRPQPRYPFAFLQGDALKPPVRLEDFDVIHASPPCQSYSKTRKILEGKGLPNRGQDLVASTRALLAGQAYVMENVPGAPLRHPVLLCGEMFGLRVIRHRLFESSVGLLTPPHPQHQGGTNSHRGYSRGGRYVTVGGHNYNPTDGRDAMGIDWMTRDELNEAIPPAFTEFIGRQLINALRRQEVA